MIKLKVIFLVGVACIATNAGAAIVPERSPYDPRIRYADYNDADIVSLDTVAGVGTMIVLGEGEEVVSHGFGDSAAYLFSPVGNVIYLKPAVQNADSNLNIVTNKRIYAIDLKFRGLDRKFTVSQLRFRYPEDRKQEEKLESSKQKVQEGFEARRDGFNLNYTMSGSKDIAPVNVWDDNEFTYIKVEGNRDLPTVYLSDGKGGESLVNFNVEGKSANILVVHRVAEKWILRRGDSVLAVYNESFDSVGVTNDSRTRSPAITRQIKDRANVR